MKIYKIILSVVFITVFACANIFADFRNDFRQSPGLPQAELLEEQSIAVRAELLLEGIFNKLGDGWYTIPNGLNKYFRYNSANQKLKDQDWKDHWGQTLFVDLAFKPTDWFYGQFGLEFINNYADRYWMSVNQPHRMSENGQTFSQFNWNTAKFVIHNDWASLGYYRNQPHYNWQYEGDMFNLYQMQPDPYNDLRISGRSVPEWWQLNMEGTAGDFQLIYGEEAIVDYKKGFYLKYRNIFNSNINLFYTDHIIPYGKPDERMRTAEVSTDFNIRDNILQVGAMFRPFRLDEKYQYVDGTVPAGSGYGGTQYVIKEDETSMKDAFGGSVKFTMPQTLVINLVSAKYTYQGLSAGNKQQIDAEVQHNIFEFLTGALNVMHRKPLQRAIPAVGSSFGPDLISPRGQNQPFWVWWRNAPTGWDNRETDEFAFTFTYDPTPDTWFYQFEPNTIEEWNLNPQEDSLFSFASKLKFTRYLGGTDRQIYRSENDEIIWENFSGIPVAGALPTKGYLTSFYFLTRMFIDKAEIIYDFEVGEDVATQSAAYAGAEVFLKPTTGYFKTNLTLKTDPYTFKVGYAKDAWGPEDWHRNFGAAFDELYMAQASRNIGTCLNVGVDYIGGRKTDLPILTSIDGDTHSRNEIGYFDEIRIFARIIFDGLFKFGKEEREIKVVDNILPQVDLKLSPDIIMPTKGQKAYLEPMAKDENGIEKWEINILSPERAVVQTFSGIGEPPAMIEWNGKDYDDKFIPDATYYAQLEAFDTFGNSAKSDIRQVVLVTPELQLEETDRGLKMSFSAKVLFDFDKTNLKPAATKILKEAVRLLNIYFKNDISVEGHTDSYGTLKYNQNLSERRAKSVSDYLTANGVNAERITNVGFGETVPVATNKTSAGREQNRRVEIIILNNKKQVE